MKTLYYNGKILNPTGKSFQEFSALAVEHGRILGSGTLETLQGEYDKRINLQGKTLLPAFNDAHCHIWKIGQLRTTALDVRGVDSIPKIGEMLAERAKILPEGEWLYARGFNETVLREGRMPTAADLEPYVPHHPVLLTRTCAHIHVANMTALKYAGIDSNTTAPEGGIIGQDKGKPNGLLYETAVGLVQRVAPKTTVEQYKHWILAGLEHLKAVGYGAATDAAVDPVLYQAYRELLAEDKLPIRVNLLYIRRPDGGSETFPLPEKTLHPMLRCDSVKFFADGGLSGATAALKVNYKGLDHSGILRFSTEDLYALSKEAVEGGFRLATHAIGDRTIDQVLEVYSHFGRGHRIEHFGLPSDSQLETAYNNGVSAVPQAIFLHELRNNFLRYLTPEYLARCYNLRRMWDSGIDVALSTDAPVVKETDPLKGIHAALFEGLTEGSNISYPEAVYGFTVAGAKVQGDEANFGDLTTGKWADLLILNEDKVEEVVVSKAEG